MNGVSGEVAKRYVSALIDLAENAGRLKDVEKDFGAIRTLIDESPEFRLLILSPALGKDRQAVAVQAVSKKAGFHKLTQNFLGVIAQNGRLNALPAMLETFTVMLAERRGEIRAQIETAFALTSAQEKALSESIAATVGKKVSLDVSVNADLIGGMVVRVGSRMIDNSVKRRLERLRMSMRDPEQAA